MRLNRTQVLVRAIRNIIPTLRWLAARLDAHGRVSEASECRACASYLKGAWRDYADAAGVPYQETRNP